MTKEQIKEAIEDGELYAADITGTTAYVYYEPNGIAHEHAAFYELAEDGEWTWQHDIHGDIFLAIGGEKEEREMLEMLGLIDNPNPN